MGIPQAFKVGRDPVSLAHATFVKLSKPLFDFCTGNSTNLPSQCLDRIRTPKMFGNAKCLVPRFLVAIGPKVEFRDLCLKVQIDFSDTCRICEYEYICE